MSYSDPRSQAAGVPARRPAWPLATSAVGAVLLAAVTDALTTRLVALWPDALAAGRLWPTPGTLAIDHLVAVPVLTVGAAVAAWWGVSLVLITVSLLAERAGVRSAALVRCIHALTPRTLRRLAVAGVGAGLTFSALPAHAAEAPPDLGWSATQPAEASALPSQAVRAQPPSSLEPAMPELTAADPSSPSVPTDPTSLGPLSPPEKTAPTIPRVEQAEQVERAEQVDTPAPTGGTPRRPAPPGTAGAETSTPPPEQPAASPPGAPAAAGRAPTSRPADGQHPSAHSSRGEDLPTPAPAHVDLSAGATPSTVVVAAGDTLWDLAAARLPPEATDAQIATSWQAWYALNAAVIGQDPDLLHPRQVLHVPQTG